jgi:hypothetical protein
MRARTPASRLVARLPWSTHGVVDLARTTAICAALLGIPATSVTGQTLRPMEGLRRTEPPPRFVVSLIPAGAVRPYASGTVADVNLVPVSFEWAIAPRLGMQVRPWVTLRLTEPRDREVGHLGAGLLLPVYRFRAGRGPRQDRPYGGTYGAPVLESTWDRLDRSLTTTLAAELGYRGTVDDAWTWTIGGQLGVSRNTRFDTEGAWWPHVGLYLSAGMWVR